MKYLEILQQTGLHPNFWCSEDYFKFAGWKEHEIIIKDNFKACCVVDSDCKYMLPVIDSDRFVHYIYPYWAGFSDNLDNNLNSKFLDYEFIYSPIEDINSLTGREWKTTRKNIHKVENQLGKLSLKFIDPILANPNVIANLLEQWTENNRIRTIEDGDVMIKYLIENKSRLMLADSYNKILGILAWDENWEYINFRYCLVAQFPGLSDYARILFREWVYKNHSPILINDGGCLDRDGLYQYKKRLNPIRINKIYSTL